MRGRRCSASGCHKADYNGTTNPNHVAAGFPQDCTVCHNTVQWKGAHFDHNGATKFPLTGAHISVNCSQCHLNNRFAGTPSDCIACHLADYNRNHEPQSQSSRISADLHALAIRRRNGRELVLITRRPRTFHLQEPMSTLLVPNAMPTTDLPEHLRIVPPVI